MIRKGMKVEIQDVYGGPPSVFTFIQFISGDRPTIVVMNETNELKFFDVYDNNIKVIE